MTSQEKLGIRFDVDVNSAGVTELRNYLIDPSRALNRIERYQRRRIADAFSIGVSPRTGRAWKPLQGVRRGQKPLVGKNNSIFRSLYSRTTAEGVEVGYTSWLADIHNWGVRTRPHVIVPKNRQMLYWDGARHPVRRVNHPGSNIPARELIGYSRADEAEWARILLIEATKAWDGV